ncbi:MAG: purine-nucleoside phosphorylase [Bacilli bacterium]
MSTHIGAQEGEIARTVLLPGDPLRARHIAETFLEGAVLYNEVRGMHGYTGQYKGRRLSVQGTGMGVPSISIYAHELLADYGVRTLIRVGSCGAMQEYIQMRDLILAMSCSTDSAVNHSLFNPVAFAPSADFALLHSAHQLALERGFPVHVGNILTTDSFYNDDKETLKQLILHGTLAVEMESAALYTLAARFQAKALTILTVSDHLTSGEQTTAKERQTSFNQMIELALDTAIRAIDSNPAQ